MRLTRGKRFLFFLGVITLFLRCATDPGTSTPVAGAGITFTYATGDVRVVTSIEGTTLKAAALLFDTDSVTGTLGQATAIENGVSVAWPEEISFELPDCNTRPTLLTSEEYPLFKIFTYTYPSLCTPSATDIDAQATLIISKDGSSRTINDTTSGVTEQTYTSSGTWTAPTGVTSLTVECWGGGGGGGGGSNSSGGGGGGGGAYSKIIALAVSPGTTYTVTVGSGGLGSDDGGTSSGNPGGDTWFSTPATVLAKGGGGGGGELVLGVAGSGGASASGIGDVKYSGGDGSAKSFGDSGSGGSSAGTSTNGNAGAALVGGTAPTGGGAGGAGKSNAVAVPGDAGSSPGGAGGGGPIPTKAGGAGAAGKVILDW